MLRALRRVLVPTVAILLIYATSALCKAVVAAGDLLQGEEDLRHKCESDAVFARQIYDSLCIPVTNAIAVLLEEELTRFAEGGGKQGGDR